MTGSIPIRSLASAREHQSRVTRSQRRRFGLTLHVQIICLILQIPFANSCLILRGGLSFNAIEEVAVPICSMEGTVFSQRCFGLIGRAARFTGLQGLC